MEFLHFFVQECFLLTRDQMLFFFLLNISSMYTVKPNWVETLGSYFLIRFLAEKIQINSRTSSYYAYPVFEKIADDKLYTRMYATYRVIR